MLPTTTTPNGFRYFKDKKPLTYKPIADGFITTSGNPSLGMKYGNQYSNIPQKPVNEQSVKSNDIKFNNGLGTEWQS